MASSISVPKRLPVATNGIVLIHVDFLITGIVMTFIGPMLPILAARWSLTDAQSGSLIFVQFFSSMFGMLVSGVSVQRQGYRFTLIVGALLMASGMALLASGSWGIGDRSQSAFSGLATGSQLPRVIFAPQRSTRRAARQRSM